MTMGSFTEAGTCWLTCTLHTSPFCLLMPREADLYRLYRETPSTSGFLSAQLMQSLSKERGREESEVKASISHPVSSHPFRPKDGKSSPSVTSPRHYSVTCGFPIVCPHFGKQSLHYIPLELPKQGLHSLHWTFSCIHSIPMLTSDSGSKQYSRGMNSITFTLVILSSSFYPSIPLLLSSYLISHGRRKYCKIETQFRFFQMGQWNDKVLRVLEHE